MCFAFTKRVIFICRIRMCVFESVKRNGGGTIQTSNQATGFTNDFETANHKTRQTSYRPVGYARKKSVDPKHNFFFFGRGGKKL